MLDSAYCFGFDVFLVPAVFFVFGSNIKNVAIDQSCDKQRNKNHYGQGDGDVQCAKDLSLNKVKRAAYQRSGNKSPRFWHTGRMQQNDARHVEQGNNDNYTLEELKPHPDPIKVLVKILILLGHTTGRDSYFKQTGLFYDRSKSGVEINKKDFRRSP